MSTGLSDRPLRIATRASDLALFQANAVARALGARGVATEVVPIRTKGDEVIDRPLAAIGDKGLFTKELEEALLNGDVDCCVHSLKDLPTTSPDGLTIGAHLEREDPRDVLVVQPALGVQRLEDLPLGARVGTSSPRRRCQLAVRRPDVRVVDLRGNVPTRIDKVHSGAVDAAILAAAGMRRLRLNAHVSSWLDAPAWLPAPGQGVIAVQVRQDDARTCAIVAPLDHRDTAIAAGAERSVLAALDGGCQLPLGALVVRDPRDERPALLFGFLANPVHGFIARGAVPLGEDLQLTGSILARILTSRLESERATMGVTHV